MIGKRITYNIRIIPLAAAIAAVCVIAACGVRRPRAVKPPELLFREVWGYLMKGEEKQVTGEEPFTDILYFGVSFGRDCRLKGSAVLPTIAFRGRPPRIHLVVFLLNDPTAFRQCAGGDTAAREKLVSDIAAMAKDYAGVQIDFESLEAGDRDALLAFMSSLRARLPDAMLTIAVPAKTTASGKPAYDYAALAGICDRVFIMAYDQHWETSEPGPIASLSWCETVAARGLEAVPRERLVMGLPLYGRAWQARKINRALTWKDAEELSRRAGGARRAEEHGAFFEYTEQVTVRVYYEDPVSIRAKLRLYHSYGIQAVAFWRIGQGAPWWWEDVGLGVR